MSQSGRTEKKSSETSEKPKPLTKWVLPKRQDSSQTRPDQIKSAVSAINNGHGLMSGSRNGGRKRKLGVGRRKPSMTRTGSAAHSVFAPVSTETPAVADAPRVQRRLASPAPTSER